MAVCSPILDFRGLSLCAGVGGLDLGLHLAEPGYRAVGYVERNAFAAAALVARMADTSLAPAPVWDDLKSFDGRPWRGRVHIVSAGYPCQPFSYSGHRRGEEDPRHLWPDVARILRDVQPGFCFFENVAGHLSLGFHDVARDLQGMGYRVAATVVSAAEVGGSHIRERMFILAHADRYDVSQSGLHSPRPRRAAFPAGHEPDRQAGWDGQCCDVLDAADGHDAGRGVGVAEPPIFAPLPGDLAKWGTALGRWPALKPCLHGLADGMANRVERPIAAGNGVVPLAAARAWHDLRFELGV